MGRIDDNSLKLSEVASWYDGGAEASGSDEGRMLRGEVLVLVETGSNSSKDAVGASGFLVEASVGLLGESDS